MRQSMRGSSWVVYFEAEQYSDLYIDIYSSWKPFNPLHVWLSKFGWRMNKTGWKNKRDDCRLLEDKGLNEVKRLSMADNRVKETSDNPTPEPSQTELKGMLADIQAKVTNIQKEKQSLKEDTVQLKASFQSGSEMWYG